MIIHFWNLPEKRTYIKLKEKFKEELAKTLENKKYSWKIRNKIKKGKINLIKIKEISKQENIPLNTIEKNIGWIGGNNSKGLLNPKFPINFSNRNGGRFIAAIINDGTLTNNGKNNHGRLMYDNFNKSLRESVINDYLKIFGGDKNEIAFRSSERKKYLEFSSVIRDIIELVIKEKGSKNESNLELPKFIFKNKKTMIGWIEQTIADEGEVKNYPKENRRSIVWRRSFDVTNIIKQKIKKDTSIRQLPKKIQNLLEKQECKLIEGEKRILNFLKIDYSVYNLGIYLTTKEKIRTRFQVNITKRENLLNLRKIIRIPSDEKNEKFTKAIKDFVRYKEPLNIKKVILNLGKNKKTFTSIDLKLKMKYKNISNTSKWLKIFEEEGLIKKIKEFSYNKNHKQPAIYQLTLSK
ncbi:hypothetical protein CL618_01270 [archaeon]|nr:hypothetical protein [archaeon]|tara:strand:+ start:1022 stop:2245 length:1224 start_codon:yes stop_codon:yes gene_type:complete